MPSIAFFTSAYERPNCIVTNLIGSITAMFSCLTFIYVGVTGAIRPTRLTVTLSGNFFTQFRVL